MVTLWAAIYLRISLRRGVCVVLPVVFFRYWSAAFDGSRLVGCRWRLFPFVVPRLLAPGFFWLAEESCLDERYVCVMRLRL